MMSPRVEGQAIQHVHVSGPRAQYGTPASPGTAIRTQPAERHPDDRDDPGIHDAARRDGQTSQRSSYEGHPGCGRHDEAEQLIEEVRGDDAGMAAHEPRPPVLLMSGGRASAALRAYQDRF